MTLANKENNANTLSVSLIHRAPYMPHDNNGDNNVNNNENNKGNNNGDNITNNNDDQSFESSTKMLVVRPTENFCFGRLIIFFRRPLNANFSVSPTLAC